MKELPGPKAEYPFPLEYPLIMAESDFSPLLAKLRQSEFRDTVALSVRFYSEEPHKNKWQVTLYAASAEVLANLARTGASIISEVWYGADLTPRREGD